MNKRICLFAGYNLGNYIQQYVLDYIKEIAVYADIYYLADNNEIDDITVRQLSSFCKQVIFIRHGKYDFGSYSELAVKYVGWDTICKYDELIFANDSCVCVNSFEKVFEKMDSVECDSWGLLSTDESNYGYFRKLDDYLKLQEADVPYFCIGSYFLVFRKNVILDNDFRKFISNVKKESDRLQVCLKYEMGLTKFLQNKNYTIKCFIDIVYRNVTIYNYQGIRLVRDGFPLVKIKTFRENPLSLTVLKQLSHCVSMYVGSNKLDAYLKSLKIYLSNNPPMGLFSTVNADYKQENTALIIYFNVAADTIGGGMLSIDRFINRTIKQFENQAVKPRVILSGLPLKNKKVKYSKFQQSIDMFHFDEIVASSIPLKLMLNIPEYYLPGFISELNELQKQWLHSIPYLHINIMNQNNDYCPDRLYFEMCKEYTDLVTMTSAHQEYSSIHIAEKYNCPVKLLTPFLPEFFKSPFETKSNVIAISPDNFIFDGLSMKEQAISHLQKHLPDYELVIIENMDLDDYKNLISKSRFTITFGEGYDGYYIEPFLSNSVSFAVYNPTFFPAQFLKAPTVYSSYDEFITNIIDDIRNLEANQNLYNAYVQQTTKMIHDVTNNNIAQKNLEDFFSACYDHVPDMCHGVVSSLSNNFKYFNK